MSDIFIDAEGHVIKNSMVDEHSIIKITEKVPDAKNIGKIICGETNSNILTFEMNRFYDNVDMISKNIKFIIKTPSFSFDDYASNVQHNANLIRFSWVVPYSATQEAGNVNVAIEFFDDSYSLKTMPFIIKVDKSINSEETQLEVPANWYISIESRILQLENKTNENIADVVEDYMNEHPVQAVSDEHITEVAVASFGSDDFNTAVDTQVNAYLDEKEINKRVDTGMSTSDITPTFEKGGFYYSNNILTETTYMTYAKCGFMDIGLYKTISIKLNNNLYTYRIVQYDRGDGTATSYRDYSEGSYCAENLDLTLSKRYIRIILKKADGTDVDLTEIQTVLTITMENATQIKTEVLSKSENPLYKASAYYDGDSICYGANSSGNSYPDIIAERNEMYLTKKAVSGTTIAIRDGYTNSILERVKAMTDDYDYVVLEGGYNDCVQGVTLGTITTGYQTDVDESTFIGAMESICKFLCTNYFEKKKLFIVPHRTLNTEVDSYYDSAITVCKKWGIPTIDLRDECNLIPFIGETVQTQYFEGANTGVHPTEQGYRVFYVPKIEGRMKTL